MTGAVQRGGTTLVALATLLACRPATSTPPGSASSGGDAGDVADTPASADPAGALDPDDPAQAPEPEPEPPGWAARGPSSCELACAEVYACVLVEGERGGAEAAAIELGCLDACVTTDARGQGALFGCALPPERGPQTCAAFLGCARDAWPRPDPDADADAGDRPKIEFSGRGCERACQALAWCGGVDRTDDDREAIELCSELCLQALTPELEREAGECTNMGDCEAIEACITSLPGA